MGKVLKQNFQTFFQDVTITIAVCLVPLACSANILKYYVQMTGCFFGVWKQYWSSSKIPSVTRTDRRDWARAVSPQLSHWELSGEHSHGYESWLFFGKHTREAQWLSQGEPPPEQSKSDLHRKKVTLCFWWEKLSEAIQLELTGRNNVNIFFHDSARPRLAKMSR